MKAADMGTEGVPTEGALVDNGGVVNCSLDSISVTFLDTSEEIPVRRQRCFS